MANSLALNASNPTAGLGTFSYTVTADGSYSVEVKSFIPQSSVLDIKIKLDATTKVENGGLATDPTPTQQIEGSSWKGYATAGQVISVVLASTSSAVDAATKSIINLYQGL